MKMWGYCYKGILAKYKCKLYCLFWFLDCKSRNSIVQLRKYGKKTGDDSVKLNELQALMGEQYPTTRQAQEQLYQRMLRIGLDPSGLYQELEMDAKFVNMHRDTSYSNMSIQLHSHSFYELLYCRANCGAEYLIGSRRYRLQKGDILFVGPGISHRPILPEVMAEPYQRDVLWFSEELVKFLNQSFSVQTVTAPASHLLRSAGTRWEFLGEIFRRGVTEAEEKGPGWELAVMGIALEILTYLSRAQDDENTTLPKAEKPGLLDQVMAYIEENLHQKITLKDTARHCFASESTISHLFQQKMGVSFYRCVTQRRLIAAKELIEQGHPMEEICHWVGFGDYSTFYRAFKQEYGIGPQQYRRLQTGSQST